MKRIVVCCDGTWNRSDQRKNGSLYPTNVWKLWVAVAPVGARGEAQVTHYQPGVGTAGFDRLLGGAFGWGLSIHIKESYRFIVDLFAPGDELFLFGFSRGAYVARSLAGLIRTCGVLKREHVAKLDDGYALYRRRNDRDYLPSGAAATLFRRDNSFETRIAFIGVWDTVGALGIPTGMWWIPTNWVGWVNQRWSFHDVKLSTYVDHAYQALAIDERRGPFVATLWEQQPTAKGQRLEQVWFPGVHSDVGGGQADPRLSDISLQWMVDRAALCGIAFDESKLAGLNPDPLGVSKDSRTGIYTWMPASDRVVGRLDVDIEGDEPGNQSVHWSAVERQKYDPEYRPENLARYLRGDGPISP